MKLEWTKYFLQNFLKELLKMLLFAFFLLDEQALENIY